MINRTRDDEQALQPERAWQHANTTSSDPTRWRGAWWWTSSAVASKLRANDYTERAKELPKTTCTQEWSKDTVKRHSTPPHLSREKKNYQQSKKLHKVSRLQNISKTSFGTEGLNIFWFLHIHCTFHRILISRNITLNMLLSVHIIPLRSSITMRSLA